MSITRERATVNMAVTVMILAAAISTTCSSKLSESMHAEPTEAPVAPFKAFDTPCLSAADPDVAVGPDLFGVAIQSSAYFYNKTTGALDHTFTWAAFKGRLVSDTHIVYDKDSQKWFVTTIVNLAENANGVQVMVSTDASATDWRYSVPIEASHAIDNPQPTVTSDKVVITESDKCVWAIDKAALIAGDAATVQPLTCDVARNNQVIAVKYGGDPPEAAYAIVMSDSSHINWISTEGRSAKATVTQHLIDVPPIDEFPGDGIIQRGEPGLQSCSNKAMWQTGHLVWTRTIRCSSGACIRIFDVNTAANTVRSDDFAIEGTQLFNGAAGLDSAGNTWLLCSAGKPAGFVGLALGGRSASGEVLQPTKIVEGHSIVNDPPRFFLGLFPRKRPPKGYPIRFGDYVAAAQDPVDGTCWLIGLYAASQGALNPQNTAGCKVVHVLKK